MVPAFSLELRRGGAFWYRLFHWYRQYNGGFPSGNGIYEGKNSP